MVVIKRLKQHMNGNIQCTASLAFKIADEYEDARTRNEKMDDDVFRSKFNNARDLIRRMNVACVEIDESIEKYLFEVYAAVRYMTTEKDGMNDFETH